MKEMKKMKDEKKAESRKASLVEAGFEAEEVSESLAAYDALDDEAFDTVIALMKKKYGKMEKKEEDKSVVKKKDEEATIEKKVASEDEAQAEETTEELFDGVDSTEATLVDASDDTDELEATRASVAEWLENNVLRK